MSDSRTPTSGRATPARRRALLGLAGLVALAAGLYFERWRVRRSRTQEVDRAAREDLADTSEPLPAAWWDQTLPTPSGANLTLRSFQGRWLLVNFWATWCAPCVREVPVLTQFQDSAPKDWQVLGLAIDQPEAVQAFVARLKMSYPVGVAGFEGLTWARTLGNAQGGLPFTVLIDPQGRLRRRKLGEIRAEDLQAWRQPA